MRIFVFRIINDLLSFKKFINEEEFNLSLKKVSGLLLKKFIIKLYSNIDTKEIIIKKNQNSKPYFNDKIFFNISYSKEYVVGVSHDSEIGLDIEDFNNNINKILYKYGNKNNINQNSYVENTKIWTKIESLLKFIGIGLKGIDKIKIMDNNLITFSNKNNYIQTDITNKLPPNICGTITTNKKIKTINLFYINQKILINILNK